MDGFYHGLVYNGTGLEYLMGGRRIRAGAGGHVGRWGRPEGGAGLERMKNGTPKSWGPDIGSAEVTTRHCHTEARTQDGHCLNFCSRILY